MSGSGYFYEMLAAEGENAACDEADTHSDADVRRAYSFGVLQNYAWRGELENCPCIPGGLVDLSLQVFHSSEVSALEIEDANGTSREDWILIGEVDCEMHHGSEEIRRLRLAAKRSAAYYIVGSRLYITTDPSDIVLALQGGIASARVSIALSRAREEFALKVSELESALESVPTTE